MYEMMLRGGGGRWTLRLPAWLSQLLPFKRNRELRAALNSIVSLCQELIRPGARSSSNKPKGHPLGHAPTRDSY